MSCARYRGIRGTDGQIHIRLTRLCINWLWFYTNQKTQNMSQEQVQIVILCKTRLKSLWVGLIWHWRDIVVFSSNLINNWLSAVPGSGGKDLSSLELAWSLACDKTPSSELLTGVDMAPGLDDRSSSRLRWLKQNTINSSSQFCKQQQFKTQIGVLSKRQMQSYWMTAEKIAGQRT